MRGAPGNTINHPVSYWVPRHSGRVFVERADMVCGIGYDRAAALGPGQARFHELRVVVTNLAVLDFATPDHSMRLRSVHPCVTVDEVTAATGFPLAIPDEEANWRASFDVDLMGTVHLVDAALPHLERSEAASIVTIASVSGREVDFAAGP